MPIMYPVLIDNLHRMEFLSSTPILHHHGRSGLTTPSITLFLTTIAIPTQDQWHHLPLKNEMLYRLHSLVAITVVAFFHCRDRRNLILGSRLV